MTFNSIGFLIFLPIVSLLYFLLPKKCVWVLLLAASYFFYGYWNWKLLYLILFTTFVSYMVTVADYVLKHTPGNTVSNLSSTRALRDVTRAYGCEYNAAAVGEVNVTTKMKETNAVIGGEGNGGVIYPESHYGRDALVGIALFLSHLAHEGKKVSELRATYPPYFIAKNRIDLTPETDVDAILTKVKEMYKDEEVNDIDGVKIDFPDKWVHLRKSNTEPIIRVYSEASTMEAADEIGQKIMDVVYSLAK